MAKCGQLQHLHILEKINIMADLEIVGEQSSIVPHYMRTSDQFGSHERKDLDSYLTLIRRKIQEKCATTQDLIQQIRRNKIGDSGHVTPNEFRYTLIKFGVILPQPLVDRIFNVFDSDRSGTMDFDEFAMWIMNSEFKPLDESIDPEQVKKEADDKKVEALRQKLIKCIELHKPIFAGFKRTISFQEWISAVGRASMPVTEKEARAIFMLFDTDDSGFVSPKNMLRWAATGDLIAPPPSRDPTKVPVLSIEDALFKVAGKDLIAVKESFAHLPHGGNGVRIKFEEFRRCLLSNGLGSNIMDARALFLSIGGEQGSGDINLLREHLTVEVNNSTVLKKKSKPQYVKSSHADRRVREALRHSFAEFKENVEAADKQGTGYIAVEVLHKLMLKFSIQISFQDFRYIIEHMDKKNNDSMVNYHHFFDSYNPANAPHQLSGVSGGLKPFTSNDGQQAKSDSLAKAKANRLQAEEDERLRSKAISINENMRKVDPSGELRRIWQRVLKECHKSDPERSGCVSRVMFIRALDGANVSKAMTPQTMSSLADRYDAGYGLVNYLACFRTYLTSMTANQEVPQKQKEPEPAKGNFKPLHPWDFEYKREKHSEPYWSTASTHLRDHNQSGPEVDPSVALTKSAKIVTVEEKAALLAQYPEKCLSGCTKVFKRVAKEMGAWTTLRNEMKNGQINSQPGKLLTTNFYAMMEKYGVKLSISEMGAVVRAFRGLGMQDVIKYNEFLRVCLLTGH